MAIQFRCRHCDQLMSIGSRRAGAVVDCTSCGRPVVVPRQSERRDRTSKAPARRAPPVPWIPQDEKQSGADVATPAAAPEAHSRHGVTALAQPVLQREDVDRSFRLRRHEKDDEDFDLTPMVDITFLLLIFFMLTASYTMQKAFSMPSQQPEQQGARQALATLEELENDYVVVRIGADNSLLVDEQRTEPNQLADRIRAARSTGRAGVLIAPHAQSLHEATVQVIDAASAIGMDRVRLAVPATEP